MSKHRRLGNAGIYRATLLHLAFTHVMLAAIRAMAPSVSTPQTHARKRSKGRAPRIVAGGLDTTLSEVEQGIVLNETGAPPAFCSTAYIFTDAVTQRTSCPEGQAVHPIAGLIGAASRHGVSVAQVQVTSH